MAALILSTLTVLMELFTFNGHLAHAAWTGAQNRKRAAIWALLGSPTR